MKRSRYGVPDEESPEWTAADFAAARPGSEVLPPNVFAALTKRRPGERGPQKAPVKVAVTLRLDADIVERFKAGGPRWQSRINEALRGKAGR